MASAIEATTTIAELTLYIQDFQSERIYLDSIGRNKSIRALVLRKAWYIFCSDVLGIWISILTSTSIESVDVSEIFEEGPRAFSDDERHEVANVVALLIRFNSCITSIRYDSRTHDAHIMETLVVPILLLNRLQPIFKAWFDGSTHRVDRERAVSAFLGSPLVRRHPQLMYFLLKSAREVLLLPQPSSSGSVPRAVAATRRSPRKRGRR